MTVYIMRTIVSLFLIFCSYVCCPIFAQSVSEEGCNPQDTINRMAEDFVVTSICIAEPTDWHDDIMGVLGHAFIRLQCKTFDMDYCFSYESESIEDNYQKVFTGNISMGLICVPTKEYIRTYQEWNRAVHEYRLNLPPQCETELWRIMDETTSRDQEKNFDLMRRGCTQTLVQFIESALYTDGKKIEYGTWPEEFNYSRREILDQQMADYPWNKFLFDDLLYDNDFNRDIVNERKIIYPKQLSNCWQNAKVDGKVLATYVGDLVEAPLVSVEKTQFTPMMLAMLLLLLAICFVFTEKPWTDYVMLAMQFLIGFVFCWLILFSNLPGTKGINMLPLYNPLVLLLWKWHKHWELPYAVALLVWAVSVSLLTMVNVNPAHVVIGLSYMVMFAKPYIQKKMLRR